MKDIVFENADQKAEYAALSLKDQKYYRTFRRQYNYTHTDFMESWRLLHAPDKDE